MDGVLGFFYICSYERARTLLEGNRALGVLSEYETRNTQGRGLFLNTAGVGEDQPGAIHQGEEVEIAPRLDHHHLLMQTAGRQPRARR